MFYNFFSEYVVRRWIDSKENTTMQTEHKFMAIYANLLFVFFQIKDDIGSADFSTAIQKLGITSK